MEFVKPPAERVRSFQALIEHGAGSRSGCVVMLAIDAGAGPQALLEDAYRVVGPTNARLLCGTELDGWGKQAASGPVVDGARRDFETSGERRL
jgi:hypothetical protein